MTSKYIETLDYSLMSDEEKDYPKFDYDTALKRTVAQTAESLHTVLLHGNKIDWLREYDEAEDKSTTVLWKMEKEKFDRNINHIHADALIPREYWADFKTLIGPSVKICGHQHILFAIEKMIELSLKEKRAEILVVVPCSFAKPYSHVKQIEKIVNASKHTRLFDVMVASVFPATITPFDASVCYPCFCYSTPIEKISDMFCQIDERLISKHLVEIVRRLGYKKLIFVHRNENHHQVRHLKEEYGFPDNFIVEPYKIDLYRKAHFFKNSSMELPEPKRFYYGVIGSRWLISRVLNAFFRDIFGPRVYPYFPSGWAEMDPRILEYAGYSEEAVQKVKEEVGIETPSGLVNFEW